MTATRIIEVMLVALLGFCAAGCSKDAEVRAFIEENDALVAEIKKTSEPGAARKAFEAKKGALRSKLDALRDARGFQIEEETLAALGKSLNDGVLAVCSLDAADNEPARAQYRSLCDDYEAIMKSK